MLSDLISRPCTLLLRSEDGTTDNHGNEIPGESRVAGFCEIQQVESAEPPDEGEVAAAIYDVFVRDWPALTTGDAVEVDAAVYEIVGHPNFLRNPRTAAESHVEIRARRAAGAEEAGS